MLKLLCLWARELNRIGSTFYTNLYHLLPVSNICIWQESVYKICRIFSAGFFFRRVKCNSLSIYNEVSHSFYYLNARIAFDTKEIRRLRWAQIAKIEHNHQTTGISAKCCESCTLRHCISLLNIDNSNNGNFIEMLGIYVYDFKSHYKVFIIDCLNLLLEAVVFTIMNLPKRKKN